MYNNVLMGYHNITLAVPVVNCITFLFTYLGECYVKGEQVSGKSFIGCGVVCFGVYLTISSE